VLGTVRELVEAFASKRASAGEIVESHLRRIEEVDPRVRAFVTVLADSARAQARALDEKRARGGRLGKLAGAVVALKDNLCAEGTRTTCSSRILENFVAPYDATVVARLKAEDAILIGKTNLDEFAMGSSTENSGLFATRNPWDLERVPGGSSGGSAAAVASAMASAALGSDTGGSIRQPAFMTGTVGFKPTYGRVSRYGLIAFASSLDQIGPFGRTVEDAARIMDAIQGRDENDSTSAPRAPDDFLGGLEGDVRGLRVGLPKEYFGEGLDPEVGAIVREAIAKLGCRTVDIELPMTRYGIATYYILAPAEASSNLARYDGVHFGYRSKEARDIQAVYSLSRKEGFGAEVKRRILLGTFTLSSGYYDAYYNRALKVRRLIKEDFDRAFERCDVIAGPTSPVTAFPLGARAADPLAMYLCDVYTVNTNLAGLPGVSVPVGLTRSGRLPVGLQIQAPAWGDALALRAARAVERAVGLAPLVAV
jgi:aspartyl-tRNA(Asn)/glutamyl-tRNA(Gln) amidotransferase subunit A